MNINDTLQTLNNQNSYSNEQIILLSNLARFIDTILFDFMKKLALYKKLNDANKDVTFGFPDCCGQASLILRDYLRSCDIKCFLIKVCGFNIHYYCYIPNLNLAIDTTRYQFHPKIDEKFICDYSSPNIQNEKWNYWSTVLLDFKNNSFDKILYNPVYITEEQITPIELSIELPSVSTELSKDLFLDFVDKNINTYLEHISTYQWY